MTGVAYWCERAWLPTGMASGVLVRADGAGRISDVSTVDTPPLGAHRLRGVALPGFANAHSHAFHRALRGRTHGDGGTFWTWRHAMYALADRLDPDSYLALARAAYAEMALAGVSCVGEFHYLHHAPGGRRYADPNAMGHALRQAAAEAGVRLTLLDTCYLAGGIGHDLTGTQLRFGDGTAAAWAERVTALAEDAAVASDPTTRIGAAIHSVRAVPREMLPDVVAGAGPSRPLHAHVSEQPAENEACLAAYGRTPTELLHEAGALSPRTTAVHVTHVTEQDIELLGDTNTVACFCPTTEGDLADGIGPARDLADAGCPLSLGSDQHAVVDPLLEIRALEYGERLRSNHRGRLRPEELLAAATAHGHDSLGWAGDGRIAVGAHCDLVAVRTDTPRTAGALPEQLLLAATASDVDTVVVGGRVVAREGRHETLGDVGRLLAEAIEGLWA
ncbi:formiminoglutamate deiminase [Streptoalloteichus tenebrarius]|uniref:Formiminoglutamate deiminase n=1 Tax=Streptoalloteichus tenebrarius (strain ATCC 17920 / DSM 40477 / JCM 4838 / CBS 697.72 / NBRC 16177 / NCIMB 11028 / NRRL B-12390 / A12253. 1 / ISP 5477) TaxID=1933 RepID=A0ABT1HT89_STRSD|nr:formimidoylglutamate deiminase [Streptoalloteichus tenebrarius]MCP2258730.1 formiminoglutamate deiminase [Streptoalloteichus tenebrarius]BFF02882.1 formimidoylglutamate deiminase [Streptoalloteichus tenebrarius]